jgi:hypothetical protein
MNLTKQIPLNPPLVKGDLGLPIYRTPPFLKGAGGICLLPGLAGFTIPGGAAWKWITESGPTELLLLGGQLVMSHISCRGLIHQALEAP